MNQRGEVMGLDGEPPVRRLDVIAPTNPADFIGKGLNLLIPAPTCSMTELL